MKAGRGAAPAGLDDAFRHSGRIGAPPGTTISSPCQELADALALRSTYLSPVERSRGHSEAGPGADKTPQITYALRVCGAPRGARVPQGTSQRIAPFGAPSPSILRDGPPALLRMREGRSLSRTRMRAAATTPLVLTHPLGASNRTP